MRGQKAPSAKRCIKTIPPLCVIAHTPTLVRKHRAPNGALRLGERPRGDKRNQVRKHRAPNGALRQVCRDTLVSVEVVSESTEHQKVLENPVFVTTTYSRFIVRKHRALKGALRRARKRDQVMGNRQVRTDRSPKGALRPER